MLLQSRSVTNKTNLFLLWVLVNAGGWVALVGVLGALAPLFDRFSTTWFTYGFVLAIAGCIMGVLQGLIVRNRVSIALLKWIVVTAVGFAIGSIASTWTILLDLYIVTSLPAGPILEWDPLIGGAILGLALGCSQSVLWGPPVGRAFGWVLANVVGWSAGLFLSAVTRFLLYSAVDVDDIQLLFRVLEGALVGVTTGITLVWLTRGGS
jgi:hypothetical protein